MRKGRLILVATQPVCENSEPSDASTLSIVSGYHKLVGLLITYLCFPNQF